MRAGFARVHANEDVSSGMFANQIGRENGPWRRESRCRAAGAGDAANAVGTEKFFGMRGSRSIPERAAESLSHA
jgi:hypothetical protein